METNDLTIRILQEMRDEQRTTNRRLEGLSSQFNQRFEELNSQFNQRFEVFSQRFEVLETVLRDLAQQMVMLARGVKVAIDARAESTEKIEDHERRIAELEKRVGR